MLKCNGCWSEFEQKTQAIASACGHLFCIECAQKILDSDSTCPLCEHMMTKNNMKMVHVLQEASTCKLSLCGQTPEVALQTAAEAVKFYMQQQRLQHDLKEGHLQRKIGKVQEACKKKLEEVHHGYQVAKRKYQEILHQKNGLEQDNQELQQKYSQKALQARKLQEMFKRVQSENEVMRRGSGKSNAGGSRQNGMSPAFGSRDAAQMVTTVEHRQVFGLQEASPTTAAFLSSQGMQLPGGGSRRQSALPKGFQLDPGHHSSISPPQQHMPTRRKSDVFSHMQAQQQHQQQQQQQQQRGTTALRQLLGGSSGGRYPSNSTFAGMGSPSGLVSL